MSKELHIVISFCLEHAEQAPLQRRAFLYRGLAEFCGKPEMAAEFCKMASELEAANLRCRQFALKFELKGGAQ